MASDEEKDMTNAVATIKVDQRLVELKSLRASSKGSITRIKNLIANKGDTLPAEELECRLGILESYFKQILNVQASIDKICPETEKAVNANFIGEVEEVYVSAKSKIMGLIPKRRTSAADISMSNNMTFAAPASRLRREIKIPKFDGKYAEFPKFFALFKKMVHQDQTLDNCERFLILKDSLGPRPLSAIADFDETSENYPKALERLEKCFDKKALMFEEHIAALFEMQRAAKGSAVHLRKVIDTTNARLSAMLSLGSYEDVANALIIFLVMEKLDADSQAKWEETVDYKKLSSWEECSSVLSRRCQALEAREAKSVRVDVKQYSPKDLQRESKAKINFLKRNTSTSLAIEQVICNICHKGGHEIFNCVKFIQMRPQERYSAARNCKLCIVCLRKGHWARRCSAAKCAICNLPHHELLHRNDDTGSSAQEKTEIEKAECSSTSKKSVLCEILNTSKTREVLLGTAIIMIRDISGHYQPARAILDSASQVNLMSDYFSQVLRLQKAQCTLEVNGVSETCTKITKKVETTIKSRVNDYKIVLQFYILPKITGRKPDKFLDISNWNIPKNIKLADPNFNVPARIDVLLGAEIFLDLLSVGQIKLNDGLPRLQKTMFGWVVSGVTTVCDGNNKKAQSFVTNIAQKEEEDARLNNLVERFWDIEQMPIKTNFLTPEEAECERIFMESVHRDSSGKFVVKIPFKEIISDLGDSFHTAERRFLALERRLNKDPQTKKAYVEFVDEYCRLGHMSKVEAADVGSLKYFAPHQHVLRPESTSTKLRVVFDCSCKTSSGLSLNDVMMKGPIVQDDLMSIVLRFRCHKFALTADVTKMYRQAWVTTEDTKYQAILWRRSSEEKLEAYRLLTITYGTTAAPYLATRCLKKLGEDHVNEFPLGSLKVQSDFYMDDFISGADTEAELFQMYDEVSQLTNSAHFTLRKWHSNNDNFLRLVPDAEKEQTLRVNDAEIIKTLGIIWEPTTDRFRYMWPDISNSKPITKRTVLAEMSTLFDPLGLINPVIVKAKSFMQDLWIKKVAWDESLPMHLHNHWMEFRRKLKAVQDVKVPRYILNMKGYVRVEMHGFADASERAYGCCIYVRSIDNDNGVTVQLWSAKSRVAPLKTKSLPRLELMAAHLLSKLLVKTQMNFPIKIDGLYLWSDSVIVLEWLNAHPSTWTTFVANRVASIQESTKLAIWRHVPSRLNPADIISRGAYIDELLNSFWFTGPQFLMETCDKWPPNKARNKTADVNEERRKDITSLITEKQENYFVNWLEGRSDFNETRKRVAFFLCVARRIKGSQGELPALTATMLDEATVRIAYCLQQHYFGIEYRALKTKGEVRASSKVKGLSVYIESCYGVDILRVGGRLKNANLPYDVRHPILLPGESNFVKCYVRYVHEKNMHVGTQALMAILRQRFWIVHARKMVRSVTTRCLRCFRCRPMLQQQVMGNLPIERVNMAKPFTSTGVDFCGPVMTTAKQRGVRTTKSYIAVFICFATKAVHMEVVSDLSTKAFIAALKRFVARRGLCTQLFCDNGTNFVGARRELKEFREAFYEQQHQGIISQYCVANNIDFRHIPPRSPHFGGLWEAAVKSAKYHLTRILGESFLTFEELCTVVAEIEAILNSRPLTAISTDPNDEAVLTPAHFLTGGPLVGIAEPTIENEKMSLLNRWLRIKVIQQHFWTRWSTEYLHELQRKAKWTARSRNVAEGDLVLIQEDNLPPKQWLMGKVTRAIADSAGLVRIVDVNTKKGCIRRAIQKIAPIPMSE